MKKTRSGFMTIKVDLEKAYNRLLWEFIRGALQIRGLLFKGVNNIMDCVETPKMAIVWNGKKLGWFHPSPQDAIFSLPFRPLHGKIKPHLLLPICSSNLRGIKNIM